MSDAGLTSRICTYVKNHKRVMWCLGRWPLAATSIPKKKKKKCPCICPAIYIHPFSTQSWDSWGYAVNVWDKNTLLTINEHIAWRMEKGSYHSFHSVWKEKTVVERVYSIIGLYITNFLEQNWSCIQPIIGPENRKACLFISMNQGPVNYIYITFVIFGSCFINIYFFTRCE